MNVYSELVRAQFEHLSSEPTGLSGRFMIDTSDSRSLLAKIYLTGGSLGSMWARIKTHKDDFVWDNSGVGFPMSWNDSPNQYTRLDSSYPMQGTNPRNGEVVTIRVTSPTTSGRGARTYFASDFEMNGESYQPFLTHDQTRVYQFKYDSTNSQAAVSGHGVACAPNTATAGACNHVAIHPSGKFIAFAHDTTPFISIYAYQGGVIGRKMADPATLATGNGQAVAWSPDGMFVALAHGTSPFVTVWEFDQQAGAIGIKLTNAGTLPTGQGNGVQWSPDGAYLAVAHTTSPFVSVYPWTAAGFGTKLSDPATLPTGNGYAVGWQPISSALSQYLAVAHDTTPFVSVYPISFGSFGTKVTNPATLPSGNARGVAFNPQDSAMILAVQASPYLEAWAFSAGTLGTKYGVPSPLPGGNGEDCCWSPDGAFAIWGGATSTVKTYTWNSTLHTLTGTSAPVSVPATTATGVAVSPDARYLAMAGSGATLRSLSAPAPRPTRRYFRLG